MSRLTRVAEWLTAARAAWLAALVAVVVYLPAVANGWAGDDPIVVMDNPAAHGIGPALTAWFESYWPEPWRMAGLYRPFTILTYGLDWRLSGGAVWWFHVTNVLAHAVACGLVVLVAARWLRPVGALAAGLVFAVHPVHVEAAANVVGRAEALAAIGVLGAVLAARRYRRAGRAASRRAWLGATVALVALAMFSKEHGVIAIAVIGLDHFLGREPARAPATRLYLATGAVTIGWLFLWRAIASPYVAAASHSAFFGLSTGERLTTMLPAYLDVLRVLAWPFRLASDYSPQVIPLRLEWTVLAALGLAATVAVLALGVLSIKRAPAVAFGILVAVASYAPTSNVLFTSGVIIAERTLYLAIMAPALAVGWAVLEAWPTPRRALAAAALTTVVVAFAWRTVERIPFWREPVTPFIEGSLDYPENYRARIPLSDYVAFRGDSARALAELLVAGALLPTEPYVANNAATFARAHGRLLMARREARRAYTLHPLDSRIVETLVVAELGVGRADSALAVAARGVEQLPGDPLAAETYARALEATGAPAWRRLLARARHDWLTGALAAATARLDSAAADAGAGGVGSGVCAELDRAGYVIAMLRPSVRERFDEAGECRA